MEALDLINVPETKLNAQQAMACFTCATCVSGCPATGIDGFDARKLVRMAVLGMEKELIDARWPWICTMCGRCDYACPMGVKIGDLIRNIRYSSPKDGEQLRHPQGRFRLRHERCGRGIRRRGRL
ncbi:MAG: 4Fe-4S dicluster domain-containing protein [Deltaproteobacteria bacterium]|nr:4Fe-4S dicluster domain-containing protein [Deltaproteobacteria bacterium]